MEVLGSSAELAQRDQSGVVDDVSVIAIPHRADRNERPHLVRSNAVGSALPAPGGEGCHVESGVRSRVRRRVGWRSANYVAAVMSAVDALPVVFGQRRTHRWFSWLPMPGNRQLTQLFVRRQLTVTLSRLKSETGLNEMAADGQSASAARLNVLVEAVGAKSSNVLPVVIVLGTIGLMVSLLSIVLPGLQQEADLLGSLPRVVALDGAAVAASATAFDGNPSVFSPVDLEGVANALGLAALVVFGLFSVLAGSAHAAVAILDDPWRYDRRKPFLPAVRRGPVPTQRFVFGVRPRRIHTPVAADLIRNGALYMVLAVFVLLPRIGDFAAGKSELIEYWRVGAAELVWLTVLLAFPAALLIVYLVIRHQRSSDGRAVPPPKGWRIAVGTAFAFATGLSVVGASTWVFDARLTAGADLSIYRDGYMMVDDVQRFADISGLQVQSLSWYPVDVAASDGLVSADLLVTELKSAADFLSADRDDEALGRLKDSAGRPDASQERSDVWISDGLASRLDPAQGDQVDFALFGEETVQARTTTVFITLSTDNPIIVLDVANFPHDVYDLEIDEIFLRATDGPLRDDSEAMNQINLAVDDLDGWHKVDLRREFAFDDSAGTAYVILLPVSAFAAVAVAFGRPWRWRRNQDEHQGLAAPATPQGPRPPLPPPVP